MATPHIGADLGLVAPVVLMPGDPERADLIARTVLADAHSTAPIRGISIHTGTYQGQPLSVMASGMGMPSMTLYATQLYRFCGVQRIVRMGTAGGLGPDMMPGDVLIATGAHTTSSMNELRMPGVHFAAVADFTMASAAMRAAQRDPHVVAGVVVSNDHFYRDFMAGYHEILAAHSVLGSDMETAGLYGVAQAHGRAALAVLTVSDHLIREDLHMTSHERASTIDKALPLALAAAFS